MEISDKRRHEREDIIKVIDCSTYQQSNELIKFNCFIANISQSGIRLMTINPLKIGQEITIRDSLMSDRKTATVRWSKEEYNGLYYSYGLEFIG